MGYNNWPYWLRGGIIGITFLLVVFLSWLIWALTVPRSDLLGLAVLGALYYGVIALLPVFLIGAAIGLIVQKIKV